MKSKRFAIFTHDAYGLGHVRRSARILQSIHKLDPNASLLLITGSQSSHVYDLIPQNTDFVKIPTIVTSGTPELRPNTLNLSAFEIASLRAKIIYHTLETFDPDVLLVDNFPLGTRFELIDSLKLMRSRSSLAVLGLRDILDPPQKVIKEWTRDNLYSLVDRYYNKILVYGIKSVFNVSESYMFKDSLASKLDYCGYIADSFVQTQLALEHAKSLGLTKNYFIATVGGGGDGYPILNTFVETVDKFPEYQHVVVTGELMPDTQFVDLKEKIKDIPNIILLKHTKFLPELLRGAALVISMGGYNTCSEILSNQCRAIIIPRSWRSGEHTAKGLTGEDGEQVSRAKGLKRIGLVGMLPSSSLNSRSLAEAIDKVLHKPLPTNYNSLNFDGAHNVASTLIQLLNKGVGNGQ